MCSGFLCYVCGLIILEFMVLFMVSNSWIGPGFFYFLFFIFYFLWLIFNFPLAIFLLLTTLGLDLFSSTYLNEVFYPWCPVIENEINLRGPPG
jgi:hypothetical protein